MEEEGRGTKGRGKNSGVRGWGRREGGGKKKKKDKRQGEGARKKERRTGRKKERKKGKWRRRRDKVVWRRSSLYAFMYVPVCTHACLFTWFQFDHASASARRTQVTHTTANLPALTLLSAAGGTLFMMRLGGGQLMYVHPPNLITLRMETDSRVHAAPWGTACC